MLSSRTFWYSGVSGACCPLPQGFDWSNEGWPPAVKPVPPLPGSRPAFRGTQRAHAPFQLGYLAIVGRENGAGHQRGKCNGNSTGRASQQHNDPPAGFSIRFLSLDPIGAAYTTGAAGETRLRSGRPPAKPALPSPEEAGTGRFLKPAHVTPLSLCRVRPRSIWQAAILLWPALTSPHRADKTRALFSAGGELRPSERPFGGTLENRKVINELAEHQWPR